jgi:hypothetical protein
LALEILEPEVNLGSNKNKYPSESQKNYLQRYIKRYLILPTSGAL